MAISLNDNNNNNDDCVLFVCFNAPFKMNWLQKKIFSVNSSNLDFEKKYIC